MYAGFWKRVAAYFIDSFILSVASYILFFIIGIIIAVLGAAGGESGGIAAVMASLLIMLIAIFAPLVYFAAFEASSLQATPGKLALSIKVTDMTGAKIGFWRAMGRNLAKIFSTIILNIGYMMAGFTERRQALHDKMAGALVVDKNADVPNMPPAPKQPGWVIFVSILVAVVPVVLFFVGIIAAISMPQYFKAVEKARMAETAVILNSIAAAQERNQFSTGRYVLDFSELDIDIPSDNGTAMGRMSNYKNFTYTLNNAAVTAQKNSSVPSQVYFLTRCYGSDRVCCSGSNSTCAASGFVISAPNECCPR